MKKYKPCIPSSMQIMAMPLLMLAGGMVLLGQPAAAQDYCLRTGYPVRTVCPQESDGSAGNNAGSGSSNPAGGSGANQGGLLGGSGANQGGLVGGAGGNNQGGLLGGMNP